LLKMNPNLMSPSDKDRANGSKMTKMIASQIYDVLTDRIDTYPPEWTWDEARDVFVVDEWGDLGGFVKQIYDERLMKLINMYDDPEEAIESGVFDNAMKLINLTNSEFVDLVGRLPDSYKRILFDTAGVPYIRDIPKNFALALQRNAPKLYQEIVSVRQQVLPAENEVRKIVKAAIDEYVEVGWYSELSDVEMYPIIEDKPEGEYGYGSVKWVLTVHGALALTDANGEDDPAEYDIRRISDNGWVSISDDYTHEKRQEEGLIDDEGNDLVLSRLIQETSLGGVKNPSQSNKFELTSPEKESGDMNDLIKAVIDAIDLRRRSGSLREARR